MFLFEKKYHQKKFGVDRTPFDPGPQGSKVMIQKIHAIWGLKFEPDLIESWD